jgi:hypothetical protein
MFGDDDEDENIYGTGKDRMVKPDVYKPPKNQDNSTLSDEQRRTIATENERATIGGGQQLQLRHQNPQKDVNKELEIARTRLSSMFNFLKELYGLDTITRNNSGINKLLQKTQTSFTNLNKITDYLANLYGLMDFSGSDKDIDDLLEFAENTYVSLKKFNRYIEDLNSIHKFPLAGTNVEKGIDLIKLFIHLRDIVLSISTTLKLEGNETSFYTNESFDAFKQGLVKYVNELHTNIISLNSAKDAETNKYNELILSSSGLQQIIKNLNNEKTELVNESKKALEKYMESTRISIKQIKEQNDKEKLTLRSENEKKILELNNTIKKLKKENMGLSKDVSKKTLEFNDQAQRLKTANDQKEEIEKQRKKLTEDYDRVAKENGSLKAQIKQGSADLESEKEASKSLQKELTEKNVEHKKNIEKIEKQKEEVTKNFDKYSEASKKKEEKAKRIKTKYDELLKTHQELIKKETENKQKIGNLEGELNNKIEETTSKIENQPNGPKLYQFIVKDGDTYKYDVDNVRNMSDKYETYQQDKTDFPEKIYEMMDVIADSMALIKQEKENFETNEMQWREKNEELIKELDKVKEENEENVESLRTLSLKYKNVKKKYKDLKTESKTSTKTGLEEETALLELKTFKRKIINLIQFYIPSSVSTKSTSMSDDKSLEIIRTLLTFKRDVYSMKVLGEPEIINDTIQIQKQGIDPEISEDDLVNIYSLVNAAVFQSRLKTLIGEMKKSSQKKFTSPTLEIKAFGSSVTLNNEMMKEKIRIQKTNQLSSPTTKYAVTLEFYKYETFISKIHIPQAKVQMVRYENNIVIDFHSLHKGTVEHNRTLLLRHIYPQGEMIIKIKTLNNMNEVRVLNFSYDLGQTSSMKYNTASMAMIMDQDKGPVVDLFFTNKNIAVHMDLMLIRDRF